MNMKTLMSIGLLAVSSLLARADLIHEWTLNNTTNDAVVGSTNYCIFKIGSTTANAPFVNDSPFGTSYSSVNLDQALNANCNLSVYGSGDGSGSMEPPQMTYAVWVKANNGWFANTSAVFAKGGSSGARVFRSSSTATNSVLQFLGNSGGLGNVGDSKNINIADGNWHHVAFTWDLTNLIYYIDGVQVGSKSTNTTSFVYSNSFANPLYIGSLGGASGFFNGRFYDFRIYNTALSATGIAALTNNPYLIHEWTFNNTVNDVLTGTTNKVVFRVGTNLTSAPFVNDSPFGIGNGMALDLTEYASYGTSNVNAYVLGSNDGTGSFEPSNMTYAVWVKNTNGWFSTTACIFAKGGNSSWRIKRASTSATNSIVNFLGATPKNVTDSKQVNIDDDNWHHLAVTLTGYSNAVYYIDGAQVGQTSGIVYSNGYTQLLTLGCLSTAGTGLWSGYLADFRIYNTALSASDIATLATVNTGATPFPAVAPAPNLIANGDFSQTANPIVVSSTYSNTFNINGSHGDFDLVWSNTIDVLNWTPYYSDPNGLTTNCVPFTDDPSYVLNGTYYLDTLVATNTHTITLNSADYYLNGLVQTNILNAATIKSGAQYQLVVSAGATANTTQFYALFAAALTVGSGANATNPATAVPNSSFLIWAQTIPTSASTATTNITSTINGADLLAAQGSGPVNVIVNQMNTNGIASYPTSPNPQDPAQVSQVKVYGVSLTVVVPANDLNHDGVVDQADVTLAEAYLSGSIDGGDYATNRENTLINTYGYTPAQALAYLNLTAFDINGDGYFDAADVAALQAMVGPVNPPTLNYSVVAPGQIQFNWSGAYKLQWNTSSLAQPSGWVDYPDTSNPVTVTNNPVIPSAFFRLSQ